MRSLQKNLLYNIVYQILVIILPLITAPYVSRTLGAEAIGIYSYTNSVAYYFLLVAMLGIANYGNRSVAATRDDQDELNHKFSGIYSLQLITFITAIVIYILYSIVVVKENKMITYLQLIYVLSGLLDISWLFFGLEQFKITVTRSTIIRVLTVVFVFLCVHEPSDLWKYTIIMTAGTALSQLSLWFFVKNNVTYVWVGWKQIFAHLKPVLVLFVPVLAYSIYKVMDKVMLGSMTTYVQVGFYNSAEKIINIPMGMITAVGTVMLPRMSNIVARGDEKTSETYIRISMKTVTIVSSAITFGLMGISDVLAPVFFGKEFAPCGKIIALLSLSVFFIAWANVVRTQYLIPNHLDHIYIISTVIGALLNLLVNWMLIPRYQAVGAAIGTIVAEFAVMIVQIIAIRKTMPIYRCILKYIPVVAIGFCMMLTVSYFGTCLGENMAGLIIQIVIGATLFSSMTIVFLITSGDEIWSLVKPIILKCVKK